MTDRDNGVSDDAPLIDIFANAVGMVLILIVIGMIAKTGGGGSGSQTEGTSPIVMSRRIATAVGQQRVPARAATLHDYEECDRKRAADPAVMPLLVLKQDHVIIDATGEKLNRGNLLREANPLDEYLATLEPAQKANIRCDILAVDLYYLALSILIEHGIRTPKDFHFRASDDEPPHPLNPLESKDRVDPRPASEEATALMRSAAAGEVVLPANVTIAAPPANNAFSAFASAASAEREGTAGPRGERQNLPSSGVWTAQAGSAESSFAAGAPAGVRFEAVPFGATRAPLRKPELDDPDLTEPTQSVSGDAVVIGTEGPSLVAHPRTHLQGIFLGGGIRSDGSEFWPTGTPGRTLTLDSVVSGAPSAAALELGLFYSIFGPLAPSQPARSIEGRRQLFENPQFRTLRPNEVAEARKRSDDIRKLLNTARQQSKPLYSQPRIVWRSEGARSPSLRIRPGVRISELVVDPAFPTPEFAKHSSASVVLRPEPFATPGQRVALRREAVVKVEQPAGNQADGWTKVSVSDASGRRREGYLWTTRRGNDLLAPAEVNEVSVDGSPVQTGFRPRSFELWPLAFIGVCVLVLKILSWRFR